MFLKILGLYHVVQRHENDMKSHFELQIAYQYEPQIDTKELSKK